MSVAFRPFDSNKLASCSNDETIKIWDLSKPQGEECIQTLNDHSNSIYSVAFSPFDSNKLASCSDDNTIKIWDLSNPQGKECIRTLKGHENWVRSVAFAPKIESKRQKEFKLNLLNPNKKRFSDIRIYIKDESNDEQTED